MPAYDDHNFDSIQDIVRSLGIYGKHELTIIDLLATLKKVFKISIDKVSLYPATDEIPKNGTVASRYVPFLGRHYAIWLYGTPRCSYWLDLEKYRDGGRFKDCVLYFNSSTSFLKLFASPQIGRATSAAVLKAREEFASMYSNPEGISSIFEAIPCDPEQHIYKVPFDTIPYLYRALWMKSPKDLLRYNDPFANTILKRQTMANHTWGVFPLEETQTKTKDTVIKDSLLKYAKYRYGGNCILAKSANDLDKEGSIHPTLAQNLAFIKSQKWKGEEKDIISSLVSYYKSCDLGRLLGIK